jgi:antitoxin component of MazEF toxin-antitoxin module
MNYTRYLALPKAWIDGMKLERGDQVDIEMDNENRLIITAIKDPGFRVVTLIDNDFAMKDGV